MLKELPEKDNGENIWVKALALVKKRDGSESYVYVAKNKITLENNIVKDFGSSSAIFEIVEYYPFSFLKSSYVPSFKTQKKEDRIKYLQRYDNSKDYSKKTLKELDFEIIRVAIEKQIEEEKEKGVPLVKTVVRELGASGVSLRTTICSANIGDSFRYTKFF